MKNFPEVFKKIIKLAVVIIAGLACFLIWYHYFGDSNTKNNLNFSYKTEKIALGGTVLNVEIVESEPLRELGLSGRKNLDSNSGMWFVFDYDSNWGFWMKEMNFPIDIIWFDSDLKVVALEKSIFPESYPKVFYSGKNSRYVLEVNAGFSEKHKIKIGDQVEVVTL